jgi:hypothetical protein
MPMSDRAKDAVKDLCVALVAAIVPPFALWAVDELKSRIARRNKDSS